MQHSYLFCHGVSPHGFAQGPQRRPRADWKALKEQSDFRAFVGVRRCLCALAHQQLSGTYIHCCWWAKLRAFASHQLRQRKTRSGLKHLKMPLYYISLLTTFLIIMFVTSLKFDSISHSQTVRTSQPISFSFSTCFKSRSIFFVNLGAQ